MIKNVDNTADRLAVRGSTQDLVEVFCYAQKILSHLLNNPVQRKRDDGITEFELLRRENEILRGELAKLDRMIEEKL